MPTRKQKHWVGRGPVISVRVEPELAERLDALAERTRRSRGDFLRMALWACLPQFENYQWEQLTRQFETAAIRDAFEEITEQLMDDALRPPRSRSLNQTNVDDET